MTEMKTELVEEKDELLARYELAQKKLKTLPDEDKVLLSEVGNHMSKLLIDEAFISTVEGLVRRKLRGALVTSDSNNIARDAISHVVESTRISIILQTTTALSKEKLDRSPTISDVRKHLINGVAGYCNTRLRRWSVDQKPLEKKKSSEVTTQSNEGESKKVAGKIGVRARAYISSDCASDSDFWDQHISTALNDEAPDLARAAEIIQSKGLSEEQIELILERISGKKFSEMAEEKGGSEDKYRKAFERALDKIGIDKKLVLGD